MGFSIQPLALEMPDGSISIVDEASGEIMLQNIEEEKEGEIE